MSFLAKAFADILRKQISSADKRQLSSVCFLLLQKRLKDRTVEGPSYEFCIDYRDKLEPMLGHFKVERDETKTLSGDKLKLLTSLFLEAFTEKGLEPANPLLKSIATKGISEGLLKDAGQYDRYRKFSPNSERFLELYRAIEITFKPNVDFPILGLVQLGDTENSNDPLLSLELFKHFDDLQASEAKPFEKVSMSASNFQDIYEARIKPVLDDVNLTSNEGADPENEKLKALTQIYIEAFLRKHPEASINPKLLRLQDTGIDQGYLDLVKKQLRNLYISLCILAVFLFSFSMVGLIISDRTKENA